MRDFRGYRVLTHTGGLPGYLSRVFMVPDLKLGIAVLTNQESGEAFDAIAYAIADAYVGGTQTRWLAGLREGPRQERGQRWPRRIARRRRRATPPRSRRCRSRGTPAPTATRGTATSPIADEGGKLVIRFSKTPLLVGDLEHWQYDTFVARWRERELRADAFVTFSLKPDGTIDQAKMQAVSPSTDFSYDFQDLLLRPVK